MADLGLAATAPSGGLCFFMCHCYVLRHLSAWNTPKSLYRLLWIQPEVSECAALSLSDGERPLGGNVDHSSRPTDERDNVLDAAVTRLEKRRF